MKTTLDKAQRCAVSYGADYPARSRQNGEYYCEVLFSPTPPRGGGARNIVGTCVFGFATDVPRRSRIDRRRLTTLPLWRYDIECEVSHG